MSQTGGETVLRVPAGAEPSLARAHAVAFGASALWSLVFALVRYLRHDEHLEPIPLILLRYDMVAAIVIAVWLFRRPSLRGLGVRGWGIVLLLAVLCGSTYQWLQAYGAEGTGSALMSMCIATAPIHAVWLGSLILRERPTWWQGAALAIAIAGVSVSAMDHSGWSSAGLIFPICVAGAGLLGGLNTVMARRVRHRIGAWDLVCVVYIVMALTNLPFTDADAVGQWRGLSGRGWAAIIYLATVGQLLPMYWWFLALRRLKATTVTFYLFVMVMLAGVWGWIRLGEALSWLDGLAMLCVLIGLILNARATRTEASLETSG